MNKDEYQPLQNDSEEYSDQQPGYGRYHRRRRRSYAQQYADQIKFAVIIVSTVPVLCIYPFIQKYFEKV